MADETNIPIRTYDEYIQLCDSFDEHKWLGEHIGNVLTEFLELKQRVRQIESNLDQFRLGNIDPEIFAKEVGFAVPQEVIEEREVFRRSALRAWGLDLGKGQD